MNQTKKTSLAKVRIWPFAFNKQQSNEKYSLQNLLLALLCQECLEDLLCQDHPAEQTENDVTNKYFYDIDLIHADWSMHTVSFLPF